MQNTIKNLGFSSLSTLYIYEKDINIETLPLRINKSLHAMKISPHSIYVMNGKPLILFFQDNKEVVNIFKQCWNFSESPIIIIKTDMDYEVYNGYEYIMKNGNFLLKQLNKDKLDYTSVISGEYIKNIKLQKDTKHQLNAKLLENIKYARNELLDNGLSKELANSLIGRIIFIRYLIDRKIILNFENQKKPLTNDELKIILSDKDKTYHLFKYLKSKDGFNGDWFPIIEDHKNNIFEEVMVSTTHLKTLIHLISGTEIKGKQQTLFDIYDFSIIPIEFISNVYESFIGEEEQSANGAYYTPTFLVDYILKYTIDDYFKNHPNEYNCRILDPACGSGIFLVETLRKLINQFEKVHKRKIEPHEIVKLTKDNIYAIDKDYNAIQVSIFSLYLTMLDYQNPKEIEEFQFPYLIESTKNLDPANFFCDDFFNTEANYNKFLKQKKLQYIIGNPPYGRGLAKKNSYSTNYIKTTGIKIANQDIVQLFILRVKDFIAPSTKISFIVTSKVLYNIQGKEFRTNYFLNTFKINHILELSPVMEEVFNAYVPVSILFYEKSSLAEIYNHNINYVSIKPNPYFSQLKMLLISKNDFKRVSQDKLIKYDHLWKILVYGNYLDFNFIQRLRKFNTIASYIDSKAIGITVGNKKNPLPKEYLTMPYVTTKYFNSFYIEHNDSKWQEKFVERVRTRDVFTSPALLLSKGISKNLDLKIGILHRDSIFSGTITSLKCQSNDTLYGIMGFLSSSFFKYFIMHTASSIGIERPQIHNPEKFSLPYIENNDVIHIAKNIEEYIKNTLIKNNSDLHQLYTDMNERILQIFNLNEQEYALIDYVNQLLIPWAMHKKYDLAFKKLEYKDEKLEEYVQIFIKKYSKIYKESNKFFQVEIIHSPYAIGIKFKVSSQPFSSEISWSKEENIKNFISLSGEHTLENLFIQRDIKGFEKDYFYIIKPNEYKNWHKSVSYIDYDEFQDAILRSEV